MKVGGRGDGDRSHLQGVAPEGAARAGDRPQRLGLRTDPEDDLVSKDVCAATPRPADSASRRPSASTSWQWARFARSAWSVDEHLSRSRASTRGSSTQCSRARRASRGRLRGFKDAGGRLPRELLLPRSEARVSDRQIAELRAAEANAPVAEAVEVTRARARSRHPAGLQAGRHLRGRVRRGSRRTSTRPTGRGRVERSDRREKIIILGERAEPHRPGHRVRLLLLSRLLPRYSTSSASRR